MAELLAPRRIGSAIGVKGGHGILRSMGLREIASGVGILSHGEPPPAAVWSRVAGDAMDLGLLGVAYGTARRKARPRLKAAMIAVVGVTLLDVLCSRRLSRERHRGLPSVPRNVSFNRTPVKYSVTINRTPQEVYEFWRNFENLPRFMTHLKSVTVHANGRSHWVAKGPAGTEVEWDAEIINEKPNELIAWQSLPGAVVSNAGTVRFEPAVGGRGTVVRVDIQYRPPGGALGANIAKLFGEAPEKQLAVDLRRIKQLLEAGEIARTTGQPAGDARSTLRRLADRFRR